MNIGMMGGMSGMGGMGGMSNLGGARPQPPSADKVMERLDSDGDGFISATEAEEAKGPLAERFATADSDGDGLVSQGELETDMEALHQEMSSRMGNQMGGPRGMMGPPPSASDLISMMDADEDGAISSDEADGRLAEEFSATDADGDGLVTAEELQAAMDAHKAERASEGVDIGSFLNNSGASVNSLFGANQYQSLLTLLGQNNEEEQSLTEQILGAGLQA